VGRPGKRALQRIAAPPLRITQPFPMAFEYTLDGRNLLIAIPDRLDIEKDAFEGEFCREPFGEIGDLLLKIDIHQARRVGSIGGGNADQTVEVCFGIGFFELLHKGFDVVEFVFVERRGSCRPSARGRRMSSVRAAKREQEGEPWLANLWCSGSMPAGR